MVSFPGFRAGGREGSLGAVTWRSAFSQATPSNGVRLSQLAMSSLGRPNGGPVVVFDEHAAYNSLVLSPYDNFLAFAGSVAEKPPPPPLPLRCSIPGGACAAMGSTDAWGNPKVHAAPPQANLTLAECCAFCTGIVSCQAWVRPPGNRTTCFAMKNVVKMVPAANREAGCPYRAVDDVAPIVAKGAEGPAALGDEGAAVEWQTWSNGISGNVETLPAGFSHRMILSTGAGLTDGLQRWGRKMRATYDTHRVDDIAVSHLSYCTAALRTTRLLLFVTSPGCHTATVAHRLAAMPLESHTNFSQCDPSAYVVSAIPGG